MNRAKRILDCLGFYFPDGDISCSLVEEIDMRWLSDWWRRDLWHGSKNYPVGRYRATLDRIAKKQLSSNGISVCTRFNRGENCVEFRTSAGEILARFRLKRFLPEYCCQRKKAHGQWISVITFSHLFPGDLISPFASLGDIPTLYGIEEVEFAKSRTF